MAGFTPPYPSDQHNDASAIPVRVVSGAASAPAKTVAAPLTPLGYAQISVGSTAVGIAAPSGATQALISVSGNAVNYRDDGTAPTASIGFPAAIGATFTYAGDLAAIRFISQSATSGATLDVLFYSA